MLVRFYSIEWSQEATSEPLPTSVTLEIEDGTDVAEIEMNGGDMLEEEFGVAVDSFEWDKIDEDDEDADPFSFVTDPDE
jgi:hypothetical protein